MKQIDERNVPVPGWHREILAERAKTDGDFSSIEDVKKRLQKLVDDHEKGCNE